MNNEPQTTNSSPDQLPPHDLAVEQGLLGCILIAQAMNGSAMEQMALCQERIKPEAFFDLRYGKVYEAMIFLAEGGHPIDVVMLRGYLEAKDARDGVDTFETMGGVGFLHDLADCAWSASALPSYLDVLVSHWSVRKMLTVLRTGMNELLYRDPETAVSTALDAIEQSVFEANEKTGSGGSFGMVTLKDVIVKLEPELSNYRRGIGMVNGISTPFTYFNKMTGGFHNSEMTVLAARPSMGKTSMAMNFVEGVAIDQGIPTLVFTMEMSNRDIGLRALCARHGADFHRIRTGHMSEGDAKKVANAATEMLEKPLILDDTPALDISAMRAKARRAKARYGIRLIVIDYVQLMHCEKKAGHSRNEELAAVSAGIKGMAKELDVPVIVLAQLNRESEKGGGEPKIHDLKDCGAIEQDADAVIMLYADKKRLDNEMYVFKQQVAEEERVKKTPNEEIGRIVDALTPKDLAMRPVNLMIGKQRNGPTGPVELYFKRESMKFIDAYGTQSNAGHAVKNEARSTELMDDDTQRWAAGQH
jgi:replicative DNA helicase